MTFMYTGAVEVSQNDLIRVFKTAKDLGVKGLIEASEEQREQARQQSSIIQKQMAEMMETSKESEKSEQSTQETVEQTVDETEEETMEEITENTIKTTSFEVESSFLEPDIDIEEEETDIQPDEQEDITVLDESDVILSENELSMVEPTKDLDERAHELMEKTTTEENRVSWVCKVCDKRGGDKSNIRRHVKSKHLKQMDSGTKNKVFVESVNDSTDTEDYDINDAIEVDLDWEMNENQEEVSFDKNEEDENVPHSQDLDSQALKMMEKEPTEDGRVSWRCNFCTKAASDKTRIRKHVISHLRERKEKKIEDDEGLDSSKARKVANYTSEDIEALKLMVKTRNEEGDSVWSCTVCSRAHFDKFRIRRHIKSLHKDSLSV